MSDIYAQHSAAFARVSAFVVMKNGERVATVAFKFPADGAGRLYAYVHWFGIEMVRGHASGGGYDKRSAACAAAARKAIADHTGDAPEEMTPALYDRRAFWCAMREGGGQSWETEVRDCGFDVHQAV